MNESKAKTIQCPLCLHRADNTCGLCHGTGMTSHPVVLSSRLPVFKGESLAERRESFRAWLESEKREIRVSMQDAEDKFQEEMSHLTRSFKTLDKLLHDVHANPLEPQNSAVRRRLFSEDNWSFPFIRMGHNPGEDLLIPQMHVRKDGSNALRIQADIRQLLQFMEPGYQDFYIMDQDLSENYKARLSHRPDGTWVLLKSYARTTANSDELHFGTDLNWALNYIVKHHFDELEDDE